jgi:hypothetical protein
MHRIVEKLILEATFIQNLIHRFFAIERYISKLETYFDIIEKKRP